ncbi:MAG: aminopeptidase P family protein [Polyangiaceae bacterium]|nr:aminopeptidase P family protein [Polyangiaceae bacterium]
MVNPSEQAQPQTAQAVQNHALHPATPTVDEVLAATPDLAASSTEAAKTQAPASGEKSQKPASHDTPTPKALLDFMVQGWRPPTAQMPEPIEHHEVFLERRRALSKMFPGETLVIPTGHEKIRSNDTTYRFRPGTEFYYLTGNTEADCVLILEAKEDGTHTDLLFVEPNPGKSDATFFTDRSKGELWVGARLGVPESKVRFSVDEARGLPDLKDYLEKLKTSGTPARTLRGFSSKADDVLAARKLQEKDENGESKEVDCDKKLAEALSEMRLIKDSMEVDELRSSIDATKRGFEDVIWALRKAKSEREVEGVFGLRARVEGNDVGYGTIAASGAHACTLHWTHNDGALRKRNLLLLDAGVEGRSLYTADITRTLPIGGKFTKEQRTIYKLVHRAQKAAMAEVKPGNDFLDPNKAAMKVLAEGLEKLGILRVSAEEALKDEHQFYKRYSLHNVSHMLGLDVHDCARARQEVYKFGKLRAGMVLTVEPGLYFQEDDLTVPEEYRGIGVRIEDDVLVTDDGYENLSEHIPAELDEVESWMARVWKKGKPAL